MNWKDVLTPDAFPDRPPSLEVRETHISWVFLTPQYAYKIKKPVNFGFLDYTTLEARKAFCEREVALNRRLCPDVYRGVLPLTQEGTHYRVGGEGKVVDWVVWMRRLPEKGMMNVLLRKGAVTREHIQLLVDVLAPFYRRAATDERIREFGSVEVIRYNTEENFEQTAPYVGTVLSPVRYRWIQAWTRAFLEERRDLFRRRQEKGWIRDCHGDLYSANICFEGTDRVYVYDCIEFNERFRFGDVASDLAFLAMDLDHHGREDLSAFLVERFEHATGDRDLRKILDFYRAYRAYVRAKIACFALDAPDLTPELREEFTWKARRYFGLAYRYAGGRPLLFVVMGLPGTGKSTLSRSLGQVLQAVHLQTDRVRKELAGLLGNPSSSLPYESGIYTPAFTARTYETLLQRAEHHLRQGEDVILDGTFRDLRWRQAALGLAERVGAWPFVVWTEAPEEVVRARLLQRTGGDLSDARVETYEAMKETFSPPLEIPSSFLIRVDTSAEPPEALREQILSRMIRELFARHRLPIS